MSEGMLLRRRPLYAPVTGGGGGIMQYLTPSGITVPTGLLVYFKFDEATGNDPVDTHRTGTACG
jgi:hypothetical protein